MQPWERFAHLMQRMFNQPLAIEPHRAALIVAAVADRFGIARINGVVPAAPMAFIMDDDDRDVARAAGQTDFGYDVENGVAVINVEGTLVQKLGTVRAWCGMTGYDTIRNAVAAALADSRVKGIALMIDSPGGEVAGCFDLVDALYEARALKPIWAILDESAYSAATAIASACSRITVPRTGGAGSIGVITMHVDYSQALEKGGINVTLITFGARKADGNPYQALPEAALNRFQAEIDRLGEIFVTTVARNRGLSVDAVRGQQAATFHGPEAVKAGLADDVMAPDAAFRALVSSFASKGV